MPFYRLSENALFFKTTPCVGVMPLFNRSFVSISFSGTWRTVAPKGIEEKEEWEAWTEQAERVCACSCLDLRLAPITSVSVLQGEQNIFLLV